MNIPLHFLPAAAGSQIRILALLFLVAVPAFAAARRSDDVVILQNGDKITGEIRSLKNGELTIQPSYAKNAVVIDWSKVQKIESTQIFAVHAFSGARTQGPLHVSRQQSSPAGAEPSQEQFPLSAITAIEPVGSTLWSNLHGNVDTGLSFTGTNSQQSATVQGSVAYTSAMRRAQLSLSDQFATQANAKNTNEMLIQSAVYRQIRQSRNYAGALANFLSSSQQNVSLRSTIGAGFERYLVMNRHSSVAGTLGLAYTDQINQPSSTGIRSERQRSMDGALALEAAFYRFSSINFTTSAWLYPGITDAGRFRMTLNQSAYYSLIQGSYVRFTIYDYYDNQPQIGTPPNNVGGVLSIGWAFH
ncbi:DUF481 domain-containing protein [Acidipila rosea]|uniref:Uncharacterized protein DUF481 n=1 Tax=Acidipila rosea TaxID=768535 RepID=A0A4R1KZA4_9BACT|nr:DUF481 domain-containing protein [Acidipila rosea]TCK70902.1 uncharacterized protein DUF481 [Acidipila rosea]